MRCLDRTLVFSWIPWLLLAGCSDDGLAPPADTDVTGGATSLVTSSGDASNEETGAGTTSTGEMGDSTTALPGDSTTGCDTSGGCEESTSTDSTTGDPPPNTCDAPEDCVLVNDCCQCAAAHVDEEIPECPMDCEQPMCDALGLPGIDVVCDGEACRLEPHDCSGLVACDALPPACPEGTLPEVGPGGGCWSGLCIPVDGCDPVPSCDYCEEGMACVEAITQLGPSFSCRAIPEACGGIPTCDCMPPDTCMAPFDSCADGDGLIQCSCPAC